MDDMEFGYSILNKNEYEKINTAFKNLVEYGSRIYDLTTETMYNIERLRLQNSAQYEECLKTLKLLKLKEKRILTNIGPHIDIADFKCHIDSYIYEETPDEIKREFLTNRIMNMISESTLPDDEFLEDEDINSIQRGIEYLKNMQLAFIKKIGIYSAKTPRLIKFKYQLAFINPKVETELLFCGFQTKNIITLTKKEKAKFLGVDLDTYETESLDCYYEYTCDMINEIMKESTKKDFDKEKIKNLLNLFGFIIKKLPTQDVIIILKEGIQDLEEDTTGILYQDVSVLERLHELLHKELNKRNDYDKEKSLNAQIYGVEEQGEMQFVESVSKDDIDNIFGLIKQVAQTYNIGMTLCSLEIEEKQNTQEFKNQIKLLKESIEKEKTFISKITDIEAVNEILNNSLNIITGIMTKHANTLENLCSADAIDNRSEVIKQRIVNLLPALYTIDVSIYKNENVPEFILQAHTIELLKKFEQIIKESDKNQKPYLITAKYEEIIANDNLTEDFINANGQIKNILLLDDETLASILEIDLDEFKFDKSELLHSYIALAIENILEFPNDDPTELENARLTFQSLYIDIATNALLDSDITFSIKPEEKTYQKTK